MALLGFMLYKINMLMMLFNKFVLLNNSLPLFDNATCWACKTQQKTTVLVDILW